MTVAERNELLAMSVSENASDPESRRYALRRGDTGIECYAALLTEWEKDELVYHGYPTHHVPAKVLREFRDGGLINNVEYKKLLRN